MKAATKTRSQRRMEKKQAVLLLVLVLVVSLASFTLGVLVGRRGAERDLTQKQQVAEKILVAKAAPSAAEKAPNSPTGQQAQDSADEEPKLSFYDNLAKENQAPLGSGINLPPQAEKPEVKPPIPLPEQPIVKKEPPPEAQAPAPQPDRSVAASLETASVVLPQVDPQGSYSVQVGSFAAAGDAGKLKKRLLDKDYPAFVVEADLGAKGTWYRVRLGPYADATAAKTVQQQLEAQEKIKGFVSRQ